MSSGSSSSSARRSYTHRYHLLSYALRNCIGLGLSPSILPPSCKLSFEKCFTKKYTTVEIIAAPSITDETIIIFFVFFTQHGSFLRTLVKIYTIVNNNAIYLTQYFGKGFSVTNFKQMRQFYCVYSQDQIGQTLSDQIRNLPTASTGRKFFLSWSHYLKP